MWEASREEITGGCALEMKSRGAAGDMFKSTGGGGIASQSVVELPPISKNGYTLIILEAFM